MVKQVLSILSLVAVASFAEWDYYGVPEPLHGAVALKTVYAYNGDFHSTELTANAQVGIVKNLALTVQGLGYQFFADENDDTKDGDGLKDFSAGAKYAITGNLNVFADVGIPIGSDGVTSDTWSVKGGISYYFNVTDNFGIGNEVALKKGFEHNDITPGFSAAYSFEGWYSYNQYFSSWLGFTFSSQLTDTEYKDNSESGTGDSNVSFWFGGTFKATKNIALHLYTDIEYAPESYWSALIFKVAYIF